MEQRATFLSSREDMYWTVVCPGKVRTTVLCHVMLWHNEQQFHCKHLKLPQYKDIELSKPHNSEWVGPALACNKDQNYHLWKAQLYCLLVNIGSIELTAISITRLHFCWPLCHMHEPHSGQEAHHICNLLVAQSVLQEVHDYLSVPSPGRSKQWGPLVLRYIAEKVAIHTHNSICTTAVWHTSHMSQVSHYRLQSCHCRIISSMWRRQWLSDIPCL